MDKLILIAGPTASGKTGVSIEIAKHIGGEIICADSMQIYKYMDIGTAKVTVEEADGIPHYMCDIVKPDEPYSVSDYVNGARYIIDDIINRGKTPIVVGGTGLYFESLIYPFGLGEAKSDPTIKAELEELLEQKGAEYLHAMLRKIDPIDAEKIHPNNTKRLIRALEIYRLTGKTKTEVSSERQLLYDIDFNVLTWEREELYARINHRVDVMMQNGLLEEVKKLVSMGYNFDLQSMQAIGYKEFAPYMRGECLLDTAVENIKKNSRNYAKRQITWFKRYDFAHFISPEECIKKYIDKN